ncbi:prolyl aminopeptidase [Pseudonocardiaceae bacterium YIM PH 21723]|nr:prolyl aminopeptidase [Pseudonocardiaceae bacterium YIM PH 21723]
MPELYPEIEPHQSGLLDVGDGNRIYWEESGNPDGKPVVFLHGGPGGGSSPKHRRLFDPAAYRIVLLDQRGCGRSLPHVKDPEADWSVNTTWHLVADLELLREHLGIERWQVFGGSWGSTLGLAYAETHPERVTELVLRGVWLVDSQDYHWAFGGPLANLFPEEWERFMEPMPVGERHDPLAAYHRLLNSPDHEIKMRAARAWTRWEMSHVWLLPKPEVLAKQEADDAFILAHTGLEVHYLRHHCWLAEDQLIDNADRLAGIPMTIVHGRYDVVCPVRSAVRLHERLPGSTLVIVPDAGHSFDEPGTLSALIEATDGYAHG